MKSFVSELRRFAPGESSVIRLKEATRIFVAMSRDVEHFGIAGVDDDVIDEQARTVQINQHAPSLSGIGRGVDLAIKRTEIKSIRVLRINYQRANIAACGSGNAPLRTIRAGERRRGNTMRSNRAKPCESKPKG